jgi:hypothetical protein
MIEGRRITYRHGRSVWMNRVAVLHGVGSLTGRSAGLCRAARPRIYREVDQRSFSEFASAVEFRLGEKSAGNLQDFIGPTEFLVLQEHHALWQMCCS